MMYKLSLAFEQQAKPERAEAVLEWMKRTHGPAEKDDTLKQTNTNGAPQRLVTLEVDAALPLGTEPPEALDEHGVVGHGLVTVDQAVEQLVVPRRGQVEAGTDGLLLGAGLGARRRKARPGDKERYHPVGSKGR